MKPQPREIVTFPPVPIRSLLSPVENFNTADAHERLSEALANIQSSHEPVLVFDGKNYIGVIALTPLLFGRRLPRAAKAGHYVIPLPVLHANDDLFMFVRTMLDTRLYALPVLDNGHLIGMLEAATIFTWFLKQPDWLTLLVRTVTYKSPVVVDKNTTIGEVYTLLKNEQLSRVLIVDLTGHVVGLVTRNDLRNTILAPTAKQRFAAPVKGQRNSFDPAEKIAWETQPVHLVMKRTVFTTKQTSMKELLQELITSDYNSVVILSQHDRPMGILSNRDILKGLWELRPDDFRLGR